MSVSLTSTGPISRKAEDDPFASAHREAVSRAKNVDNARAAVAAMTTNTHRSGSGIQSVLAGFYGEPPVQPAAVAKVDIERMHSRAKSHVGGLSGNAIRLFDLLVRADEANRGAPLVDASTSAIAHALTIKSEDAEAARRELEARELIRFFDSGSGDRGYRVCA